MTSPNQESHRLLIYFVRIDSESPFTVEDIKLQEETFKVNFLKLKKNYFLIFSNKIKNVFWMDSESILQHEKLNSYTIFIIPKFAGKLFEHLENNKLRFII